jgi:hypothetical protein
MEIIMMKPWNGWEAIISISKFGGKNRECTPPGYGVYDVDGTNLQWHYKPIGKELNFQSSIFMQVNGQGQQEMVKLRPTDRFGNTYETMPG